ncbi:MAG: spore photoproduct lyase family protein [Candidatus Omnitrophota bacterium]
MNNSLADIFKKQFLFQPNINQSRDLERLIFEIMRRENVHLEDIITYLRMDAPLKKYSGRNIFFALKNTLVKRRFPLTSRQETIDKKNIFLSRIKPGLGDNWLVQKTFKPLKIFIEKEVKESLIVKNFRTYFPDSKMEELDYYGSWREKNKFNIAQLKMPLVFIIKEKWDFLKPCPCTKEHLSCGYWILNLGFGCPFDCSYCFLQQYANFPGIVLPANLEDFFEKFDVLYKKLKKPIRIGTGEFCDSLALDHITEYSKQLIPYFQNKKVLFELKTKSDNITNLLELKPSPNIVISWSLNPEKIIAKEEIAVATLTQRLQAAAAIQQHGYAIAFHFDPIIHSYDWQALYRSTVKQLYTAVKPNLRWISLGTLRSHRELKNIAEQRFPQSNIFYGELLLGEDKKLRYPKFLRRQIYQEMLGWIKQYDDKTPVYLCMEEKEMWDILGKKNSLEIEQYLLDLF